MIARDQILEQALALNPEDRAFVVAALESSLADASAEAHASATSSGPAHGISGEELLTELQRRSAAYRNGETTARPAAEVLADLRQRQADEAAP